MKVPRKTNSDWTWVMIEEPSRCLLILDTNQGRMSVTNDIEDVLRAAHEAFDLTNTPVVYKDSDGFYDQALHRGGVFTGFKAMRELDPDRAVSLALGL